MENEPLDPSGEHSWSISEDLLREEIALVRQSDPGQRPIIVTMWVRTHPLAWLDVGQRRRARRLLAMADVLGLDVYPSVGKRVMGNDVYLNWRGWNWEAAAVRLQGIARRQGKDTWVMEAQAEPWEPGQLVYLDRAPSRSVQPEMVVQVYQRLRQAGFGSILLWGVEHWWMRMVRHQDPSWWETMSRLFSRSS